MIFKKIPIIKTPFFFAAYYEPRTERREPVDHSSTSDYTEDYYHNSHIGHKMS
ncbi:hypothetical protein BTZ20_4147 [Rhodococcus sp. MTM3W5.2]|nr:hypothetical protein BTZ20_4147 [Rhodococcus sp. MTM3W5.2]